MEYLKATQIDIDTRKDVNISEEPGTQDEWGHHLLWLGQPKGHAAGVFIAVVPAAPPYGGGSAPSRVFHHYRAEDALGRT